MTNKTVHLHDDLYDYLLDVTLREPEVLRQLREETACHPYGSMQITPEQGQFMALLVEITGARKLLEIGVFTGYSSTRMALALPPDGRITALDISAEYTATARRYWALAGVSDRIDLRLGPALETLAALAGEGAINSYDLAFIDADKTSYDGYYEYALQLLRPGGLLLIDNVLWGGKVADPAIDDANTAALRALNTKIHHDTRVSAVLLPLADGLMLARKR